MSPIIVLRLAGYLPLFFSITAACGLSLRSFATLICSWRLYLDYIYSDPKPVEACIGPFEVCCATQEDCLRSSCLDEAFRTVWEFNSYSGPDLVL